jgi:catechol 2,3-dioxygenase
MNPTTDQATESVQNRLPASTHIGRVRLAVSDLTRSIAFYRDIIGLAVLNQSETVAQLGPHGDTRILLELEEQPGIRPIAARSRLGLYHTAFLLPTRADLSRFVQHLWKYKVPFAAGDHAVSEALYLVDPDGLEVEVYADRPRSQWSYAGTLLRMGTAAVRFDELAAVSPDPAIQWQGAPAGTTVGHVHHYVGNLEEAENFYIKGLGLEITVQIPTALFTSAGGYHHHVGLNIWAAGSPPAGAKDARLLFWELVLPNSEEVARVAASLRSQGFKPSSENETTFTDTADITVRLVVA